MIDTTTQIDLDTTTSIQEALDALETGIELLDIWLIKAAHEALDRILSTPVQTAAPTMEYTFDELLAAL